MRRVALLAVFISSLSMVVSAQRPTASGALPMLVSGCLTQTDGGFFLQTPSAGSARRTRGSMSPKASTPIGGGQSALLLPRDRGWTNSPKASTPLGARSETEGFRTASVLTAKGSVPVAANELRETIYVLDADAAQLAPYTNQLIEIQAATAAKSAIAAPLRLNVESLRVVAQNCGQQSQR